MPSELLIGELANRFGLSPQAIRYYERLGLLDKPQRTNSGYRMYSGKRRWYVQLINEGLPYQKPQNYVSSGVLGLDLNVSNVAFVADNQAGLLPFADKVSDLSQEISKLQKKMQRSRACQ